MERRPFRGGPDAIRSTGTAFQGPTTVSGRRHTATTRFRGSTRDAKAALPFMRSSGSFGTNYFWQSIHYVTKVSCNRSSCSAQRPVYLYFSQKSTAFLKPIQRLYRSANNPLRHRRKMLDESSPLILRSTKYGMDCACCPGRPVPLPPCLRLTLL